MKLKGRGQIRVLSPEEREQLFTAEFLCSYDRALLAFCYLGGCRPSEVRQMVFNTNEQDSAPLEPLNSSEKS